MLIHEAMLKIEAYKLQLLIHAARKDVKADLVHCSASFARSLATYLEDYLNGRELKEPLGWNNHNGKTWNNYVKDIYDGGIQPIKQ